MMKRKYFQFTRKQVLLAVLFASLAVAVAYNIGLYNGKKIMLDAEMKEAEMIEKGMFSSLEGGIYREEIIELDAESLPKREDEQERPTPERTFKTQVESPSKDGQFYIKVGTFNERSNAQNLINRLKADPYKPWIKEESISGKTIYHVLFGGFDSETSARAFGEGLKRRSELVTEYLIIRGKP